MPPLLSWEAENGDHDNFDPAKERDCARTPRGAAKPRVADPAAVGRLAPPYPRPGFNFKGLFSLSIGLSQSLPSLAHLRLMMMSAPFYKVSILTFSPQGENFPGPTAAGGQRVGNRGGGLAAFQKSLR